MSDENTTQSYLALGAEILKLQQERDEALAELAALKNARSGLYQLSGEVFGPLTVVEVVDRDSFSPTLLVAMTEKDEYVLVYSSTYDTHFYTKTNSSVLYQLRRGEISERDVILHGETYRVQDRPVRYTPQEDEVPTVEAVFDWAKPKTVTFEEDPHAWQTQDGRVCKISEMSDCHIRNCLEMFRLCKPSGSRLKVAENMKVELSNREHQAHTRAKLLGRL